MPLPSLPAAACVMCGALRQPLPHVPALLCGAPGCTHRHAAIPAFQKCRVCTRPLEAAQLAGGVCADARCREEWLVQRPIRLEREDWAQRTAGVEARRDRAAARRGIPQDERATWRVALLPKNTDRSSRLPDTRWLAFEQHVRRCLADARARLAAGEVVPSSVVMPAVPATDEATLAQQEAEQSLLGAACAACRGVCCRSGGEHAFVRSDTMVGYLQRFPAHDDETILAHYRTYRRPRTMTHGCVFQVDDGCALPRELRGHTCNAFHCRGLNMIRGQYALGDPVRAYFVHATDNGLAGGQFVQIEVRRRQTTVGLKREACIDCGAEDAGHAHGQQ